MNPLLSSLLKFLALVAVIWLVWNFFPLLAAPFAAVALVAVGVGAAMLLGLTVLGAVLLAVLVAVVAAVLGVAVSLLPVAIPVLAVVGIVLLCRRRPGAAAA